MPLTLAHPALIIPLHRRLILSALVIGSMAPDFTKIFSLSRDVTVGHDVPGVFWFCVPVGLILFFLFQYILKKPLFLLLPVNHQKRLIPWLNPFHLRTTKKWALVIASLIIAAFTHLLWDEFTHRHGWFVERLLILQRDFIIFRHHHLEIFEALQFASTAAGLFFLAAYYLRFYQKAVPHPLPSMPLFSAKTKFILVGLLTAMALLASIIFANSHHYPMIDWETLIGRGAMAFIAIFSIELLFYCILCHFYLKKFSVTP